MDDSFFDKSDEEEEERSSLQSLLESYQLIDLRDEKYTPAVKKYMEQLTDQLNRTIDEQHEAISILRNSIQKDFVKPYLLPSNFIENFVDIFSNPTTDLYIKIALLSLSNDMMRNCSDFVPKFEVALYHCRVYEEMRRGNIHIENCLPVLNHFATHNLAFTYLNHFGFFDFLLEEIEKEKTTLSSKFALYASLRYFSGSSFIKSSKNKELIIKIADHCISKIRPEKEEESLINFKSKILAHIIITLSNLLDFISDTKYMNKIIDSGIAIAVLPLLDEENVELSEAVIIFLCYASYFSDLICIQLQKIDVVQIILRSLIITDPEDPDNKIVNIYLYSKCGYKALMIIFNTFVACSNSSNNPEFKFMKQESEIYIFECAKNIDFLTFLNHALNKGKSNEKNAAFSIIAVILYTLNQDDTISFANDFGIYELLLEKIDADQPPDEVKNAMVMAYKLANIHESSLLYRSQLSQFRKEMVCEEIDVALNEILNSSDDDSTCSRAKFLIDWIRKENEMSQKEE